MQKIPPVIKTFSSDKHEITLHIPNVRFAKENYLIQKANRGNPLTMEKILNNMNICGFEVVFYGELKSNQTKITTKCCNPDCDGAIEKTYSNYITNQEIPYCKACASIVGAINKSNKRPVLAIKDDSRIEFISIEDVSKHFNFTSQSVYHSLRNNKTHKSGWKFEFLD
jgi:hypothetical protein